MRLTTLSWLAVFLVACGGGSASDGGVGADGGPPGMDAGADPSDAGGTDAGEGVDAGDAADAGDTDAGDTDAGSADAGDSDAGGADAGSATDAGSADAGSTDAGSGDACDAMDAAEGRPCGPTERPGVRYVWNGRSCEFAAWCRCVGADCGETYADEAACLAVYGRCRPTCTVDADCPSGSEWCESGTCVPCDNSGLACDIACSPRGWNTYMRNGCAPCECGPPAGCRADTECGRGETCYAGDFCWCTGGTRSPDCCLGNICSPTGCAAPPPTGCATRGCPRGDTCQIGVGGSCTPSSCGCSDGRWACTRDCGGGSCVSP